jgi:hypothetical protein
VPSKSARGRWDAVGPAPDGASGQGRPRDAQPAGSPHRSRQAGDYSPPKRSTSVKRSSTYRTRTSRCGISAGCATTPDRWVAPRSLQPRAGATGLEPATSGVTGYFRYRTVGNRWRGFALFMRSRACMVSACRMVEPRPFGRLLPICCPSRAPRGAPTSTSSLPFVSLGEWAPLLPHERPSTGRLTRSTFRSVLRNWPTSSARRRNGHGPGWRTDLSAGAVLQLVSTRRSSVIFVRTPAHSGDSGSTSSKWPASGKGRSST